MIVLTEMDVLPGVFDGETTENVLFAESKNADSTDCRPIVVDNSAPTSACNSSFMLRSSTRTIKKRRKDFSLDDAHMKKVCSDKDDKIEMPKLKRGWELWSTEDKDIFFEALFEYGKDFDAIQNMLVQRGKKRGLTPDLLKRKDQVRFLYYRTWQKISKFVNISKEIKKEYQELYGLINYGIFRKTVKGLNEKTSMKLNELINKGHTTLKIKGKTKKLKTPMCNALKKINGLFGTENEDQAHQLPEKVIVEMTPRSNKAWSHVQAISQNPCIRMRVMSDRTLDVILEYLWKKWKCHRENLLHSIGRQDHKYKKLTVFLSPQSGVKCGIGLLPQSLPRLDVALLNYKENNLNHFFTSKEKHLPYEPKEDGASTATLETSVLPKVNEHPSRHSIDELNEIKVKQITFPVEKNPFLEDENAVFPDNLFNKADFTSLKHSERDKTESVEINIIHGKDFNMYSRECEVPNPDVLESKLSNIYETSLQGWNHESAKSVTLAELMLISGGEGKLFLEYDWTIDSEHSGLISHKLGNMLRRLAHLAANETSDYSGNKWSCCRKSVCVECRTNTAKSKNFMANKAVNTRSDFPKKKENGNGTSHEAISFISPEPCKKGSEKFANAPLPCGFRVPSLASMSVCEPQNTKITQATVNQLIQPHEFKANFLIPRKRKKQRKKSIIIQRTLLPKSTKEETVAIVPNVTKGEQHLSEMSPSNSEIKNNPFSTVNFNSTDHSTTEASGMEVFNDERKTKSYGSSSIPTQKTWKYSEKVLISPPHSPNPALLKLGFSPTDVHWQNGEVQDLSLGTLLTETPVKKNSCAVNFEPPNIIFSEQSDDSLVESSLQSIINENSTDLVHKFVKLANNIDGCKP